MYDLTKFMLVKNSGALAGWFWSMVCQEVAVGWDVGQGCDQLKVKLRLEDPVPTWLMHMAHESVLTLGRRPQFPTRWITP